MNLEDKILNRIDRLLEKGLDKLSYSDGVSYVDAAEISLAATDIFTTIYGTGSPQLDMVKEAQDREDTVTTAHHMHGYLREIRETITDGLIVDIQSEARGEALGDFLVLARESLDAEQKNVAAVLACAALEDALKWCGTDQGLEVYDQDLSSVVNALKSAGVISGPQGTILRGYVQIRNKTFHAQWDAIDVLDVKSIITFTEEFLIKYFSSPIPTDSPTDSPVEAQE